MVRWCHGAPGGNTIFVLSGPPHRFCDFCQSRLSGRSQVQQCCRFWLRTVAPRDSQLIEYCKLHFSAPFATGLLKDHFVFFDRRRKFILTRNPGGTSQLGSSSWFLLPQHQFHPTPTSNYLFISTLSVSLCHVATNHQPTRSHRIELHLHPIQLWLCLHHQQFPYLYTRLPKSSAVHSKNDFRRSVVDTNTQIMRNDWSSQVPFHLYMIFLLNLHLLSLQGYLGPSTGGYCTIRVVRCTTHYRACFIGWWLVLVCCFDLLF